MCTIVIRETSTTCRSSANRSGAKIVHAMEAMTHSLLVPVLEHLWRCGHDDRLTGATCKGGSMYLDQVIARLVEQDVDTQEFQPCSEQEVQELEQQLERQLPAAYREFLLTMGHGAGEMFQADDCFYGDLPKIQRLANILLAQN